MCRNLFDRRDIQAVSLAVSVRNIKIDLCALFAQIGQKNGRGGDAIHVVIAENRDLLMLLDGVADDGDRLSHILHQHTIIVCIAEIQTLWFFLIFCHMDRMGYQFIDSLIFRC